MFLIFLRDEHLPGKLRQELRGGVIKRDLPLVYQEHQGSRSDLLAVRGDPEQRIALHRLLRGDVRMPEHLDDRCAVA